MAEGLGIFTQSASWKSTWNWSSLQWKAKRWQRYFDVIKIQLFFIYVKHIWLYADLYFNYLNQEDSLHSLEISYDNLYSVFRSLLQNQNHKKWKSFYPRYWYGSKQKNDLVLMGRLSGVYGIYNLLKIYGDVLTIFSFFHADYPSRTLPSKVRKLLLSTLSPCSEKISEVFFEHCVQQMISDMGKGKPTKNLNCHSIYL